MWHCIWTNWAQSTKHTDTKSSRIEGTLVTRTSVLVHCDVAKFTNSLHSSTIETSLTKIHQHKMIVSSTFTYRHIMHYTHQGTPVCINRTYLSVPPSHTDNTRVHLCVSIVHTCLFHLHIQTHYALYRPGYTCMYQSYTPVIHNCVISYKIVRYHYCHHNARYQQQSMK